MRKTLSLLVLLALAFPACVSIDTTPDDDIGPIATATFDQDESPPPRSKTADVIEQVLPSLVNVRVSGFSADPFGGGGPTRGQGSGAVIDSDGIIVTNFHVVEDAVRVQIFFTDDHETVDGRVVGTDPNRDLAVVKVPTTGLTPIQIGSSDSLRLGDDVIALGFPLGLGGPTVTKGIVSGKNRSLQIPRGDEQVDFEGLLQTDAAINPGNSGGPLVDSAGRLVGINTAAASAGAAENVGFAIAIDSALPVIEEILSKPAEERAWLGVIISDLDPTIASEIGVDPDIEGALITEIVEEGPADSAGLEVGDVIVEIEGNPITGAEELTRVLTGHQPGEEVTVELVNADGTDTIEVTLGQRPVPE